MFRPVALITGRLLGPEDFGEGTEPVALVSERLWASELGGKPLGEILDDILNEYRVAHREAAEAVYGACQDYFRAGAVEAATAMRGARLQ